ncbi:PEP-CTERM sorting domain-containing protein [Aquabacterium sp. J223]|uniref:PEP-CTERM sorting domain-containing protein n=1 Tax=Aquabacterium sp. J223 TaxID=2898431 RepID=UPI0021ADBEAF|nr:PEP-CTERM sorting domain-containing protein [Aquabacterium sp. J223]UUX96739.1 PEP-CTERM sorting domain-containing protein [Aquabacterium sp. J223]
MPTLNRLLAAAAALALSAPALSITLNFEGIGHQVRPLGFYDAGAASNGSIGPDHGAVFDNEALVLTRGAYENAPSPNGVLTLFQDLEDSLVLATLSIDGGFVGEFSGFYSATSAGQISVFGAGGPNTPALGTWQVASTNGGDCPAGTQPYRCWKPFSISLAGQVGYSVVFSGIELESLYDDITYTPYVPTAPIPEPGTWALMAAGLAGLAGAARRRRNA